MKTLGNSIHGLILDMDGVLYTDSSPIGDLPAIFGRIEDRGMKAVMATNNSTRSVEMHLDRFAKYGVKLEPWQVVTSADAVAELLKNTLPAGSPIFAIGEPGLMETLSQAKFVLLSVEEAEKGKAVVFGIDRKISFEKMVEATLLVRSGVPFYATNPDITFPTPRGQIPGNGAWYSVIESATNVKPIIAGKPYPYIMELALQRLGMNKDEVVVVGDRIETDIVGGQTIGCKTALVLSGISTEAQGKAWQPKITYIAKDLTALVSD